MKTNHFLQFISNKHKIPFETINKAPKLTIGYVLPLLLRNNQMWERSASIRWISITFLPWESHLIVRQKHKNKARTTTTNLYSILLIFFMKRLIVSRTGLTTQDMYFLKKRYLDLFLIKKDRFSKFQGTSQEINSRRSQVLRD